MKRENLQMQSQFARMEIDAALSCSSGFGLFGTASELVSGDWRLAVSNGG